MSVKKESLDAEKKLRLLWWLFFVLAVLNLTSFVALFFFVRYLSVADDFLTFMWYLLLIPGIIFVLCTIVLYALKKRSLWVWPWALAVSILHLLSFPAIIIGIINLVLLFDPYVKKALRKKSKNVGD